MNNRKRMKKGNVHDSDTHAFRNAPATSPNANAHNRKRNMSFNT